MAKDALFTAFGEVAAALGSGRRAEIVDVLAQGERSVEEIAEQIGQSLANTSHHLRTLFRVGLVRTRRDGTRVYYALSSEQVEGLWAAVRTRTFPAVRATARTGSPEASTGSHTAPRQASRATVQGPERADGTRPWRRSVHHPGPSSK